MTVLFPTFLALAYGLRSRLAVNLVAIAFALVLGLVTLLFVNWYHIV
jgi:hypothetical protein